MRLQFAWWEMEELLKVKPRARFPSFKHLMWHLAMHYAKPMRVATGACARLFFAAPVALRRLRSRAIPQF